MKAYLGIVALLLSLSVHAGQDRGGDDIDHEICFDNFDENLRQIEVHVRPTALSSGHWRARVQVATQDGAVTYNVIHEFDKEGRHYETRRQENPPEMGSFWLYVDTTQNIISHPDYFLATIEADNIEGGTPTQLFCKFGESP